MKVLREKAGELYKYLFGSPQNDMTALAESANIYDFAKNTALAPIKSV